MSGPDDTARPAATPRRDFLRQAGAAGLGGMAVPLLGQHRPGPRRTHSHHRHHRRSAATPIRHVVVICQENHSFDHYFGSYPGLPAGYGIPAGFTQPDGRGGLVRPYHFASLTDGGRDPRHDWQSIHAEWDHGRLDGFVTTNGHAALGYYDQADLPYYYSLLPRYTLCASYFSGVLSNTYPNRLVLYAGTSGGITGDRVRNGSVNFPCVLDLLASRGVTFANYNFHCADNYSILALFRKWATGGSRNQLNQTAGQFYRDCAEDDLPGVSFITTARPYDEHPAANVQTGMRLVQRIITAVQQSPAWPSTAILLTYDEAGGFFDHIAPPQLDAFGPGLRVPMLIVSPYARPGYVDTSFSDHSSVLKFLETVFGLPALASVNHLFDQGTPVLNSLAGGAPFPPRDGNSALSDLTQCFTFG